MSNIADRHRDSILEGAYSIVRNLYSIVKCENAPEARLFLDELTKNINLHRSALLKAEKFAYNMMCDRFNAYRPAPLKDTDDSSNNKEVELKALEGPPSPIINYPKQKRFSPGEKIKVFVQQAVSPLEFYVIKEDDLEIRAEIEDLLTGQISSLTVLPNFETKEAPCAVLYKEAVYRGSISLNGKSDVLVCLVDHGSSHFITRRNVFSLPEDLLLKSPPLAYRCSLADTDSRRVSNAIIMDFSLAIATNPQVEVFACGSLRQGSREIVYIPDQPYVRHEPKKIRKMPVIRSSVEDEDLTPNCSLVQSRQAETTLAKLIDENWEEDEFPTLCENFSLLEEMEEE